MLALAACAPAELPPIDPPEPLDVHSDGARFRDAAGRVVLLRGASYAGLEFGTPVQPRASDFALMASWGFNVVRLPITWSRLEPLENQLDTSYLDDYVEPALAAADANGLEVVLDLHQYLWAPCFSGGNGAPRWTCEGKGYPDDTNGPLQASCDFFQGATAPDGRTLMAHVEDVWRLLATRYADDARVVGFDLFNEPMSLACLPPGDFETQALNPFYREVATVIRATGAKQTLFIEPPILRNTGAKATMENVGVDVAYAPHLYTQTAGVPGLKYNGDALTVAADYAQALEEAKALGGPLFVGEFGGDTTEAGGFRDATTQFLVDSLAQQDRRLASGVVWAFFPTDNTFSVVDAQAQEKGGLVKALVRPWARRIAGVPTRMVFDPETSAWRLEYRVEAGGPRVTEVFLPKRVYELADVQVTEGDRFELDTETGVLLVEHSDAAGEHAVVVSARARAP